MAEVWKAVVQGPAGFEKDVAIKRVLPHLAADREFIQMFIEEAKLVARLVHPNIVQVFDFGVVEAAPGEPPAEHPEYFLAMEYVDGQNLASILRRLRDRGQQIPLNLALYIATEAVTALAYAHAAKDTSGKPLSIVHRDISPHNILVSYGGEVKVADFGIARVGMNLPASEGGVLRGKISYLSPEQASFRPVDSRSDLFSLGLVLFELLTGNRLFQGANADEIVRSIKAFEGLSKADIAAVPQSVRGTVDRALRPVPDDRFADALQMETALAYALGRGGASYARNGLSAFMHELYAEERNVESVAVGAERTTTGMPYVPPEAPPQEEGEEERSVTVLGQSPWWEMLGSRQADELNATPTRVIRGTTPVPGDSELTTESPVGDRGGAPSSGDRGGAPSSAERAIERAIERATPDRSSRIDDLVPSRSFAQAVAKSPVEEEPTHSAADEDDRPTRVSEGTGASSDTAKMLGVARSRRPARVAYALAIGAALTGGLIATAFDFGGDDHTPITVSLLTLPVLPVPEDVDDLPVVDVPDVAPALPEMLGPPAPGELTGTISLSSLPSTTPTDDPEPVATKKKVVVAIAPRATPTPRPTPRKNPAIAADRGWLTVLADPWVEVWIDGKRIAAETPMRRHTLPAGRHKIKVVNPSLGFELEQRIEIGAEQELRIFVDVPGKRIQVES